MKTFLPSAFVLLFLFSACSKSAGPVGPAGATGATGAQGQAGPAGSSILSGAGAPASSLGNVGDFYIDETNSELYGPKVLSGWGTPMPLKGPAGATGASGNRILSGGYVPADTTGNNGDYYFDNATDSLYGPKTAAGWGIAASLRGAPGPAGSPDVIYYNWVAFQGTNWGPFGADPGVLAANDNYRIYQISMPALNTNVLSTGVEITYIEYITTDANGDTVDHYVSPVPGDFVNYAASEDPLETMWVVAIPNFLYFALQTAQDVGDPGILTTTTLRDTRVSYGWYYRVVIIPGGIAGTSLSYNELCEKYGIKP